MFEKFYSIALTSTGDCTKNYGVMSENTIPVYTEQESFDEGGLQNFYISSYADDEREVLERIAPHRHTYHEIILMFAAIAYKK